MSNILLKGIAPALITPFDASGNIIKDSIKKNIDMNYSQGAKGFYICGSTGEGPVLTAEKRMEVAETTVAHSNGRGIIINHVGAASPEEAIRLSKHSKECGCNAVSSVVPNFYYKYNDDEIIEYYKRIADASELPVIAYAQGLYQGDIVSLMERLIKVDGIAGVKFTLTDFYSLHRIKELNNGDINVINGPDEMLICGLSMGADAGIGSTYNVLCSEYCKLYDLFMKGDIRAAQEQQYKINSFVTIIIKYGVIRSIKYLLTLLGIDSGSSIFPGTPLTEEEKANLKREFIEAGYIF